MDRESLIDENRLASNNATEVYLPHYGQQISDVPLGVGYKAGVISTIKRGPRGVGASYAFTEPVGGNWHEVNGAEPLVQRAVGA